MSSERPILKVPKGWTYKETFRFSGRWITTYTVTHDVCGENGTGTDQSVGDGGDGWWYRRKCAERLTSFIGNHAGQCAVKRE